MLQGTAVEKPVGCGGRCCKVLQSNIWSAILVFTTTPIDPTAAFILWSVFCSLWSSSVSFQKQTLFFFKKSCFPDFSSHHFCVCNSFFNLSIIFDFPFHTSFQLFSSQNFQLLCHSLGIAIHVPFASWPTL